ncbi:hypothetical protein [Actinoplanes sp. M2I2]|uniref:HAAS signaling domain-containing protein n=1 Tax=Actinoplanes sp. M2I2 TaxID=1734444 RepID=UPI002021F7C5|nr:hypothetical protein [Actinoplanes sp. M2I2]
MKTRQNDVVTEYLHEVDQRLAGLPVLQRRELLADLAAHIAAEQAERHLASEGEVIEVLERLGSPEVVAAAAHEEAGTRPQPPARSPLSGRRLWLYVAVAAGVLAVLFLCAGAMFLGRESGSSVGPVETAVAPTPTVQSS